MKLKKRKRKNSLSRSMLDKKCRSFQIFQLLILVYKASFFFSKHLSVHTKTSFIFYSFYSNKFTDKFDASFVSIHTCNQRLVGTLKGSVLVYCAKNLTKFSIQFFFSDREKVMFFAI